MNEERLYAVLVEPHISEKATMVGDGSNQYVFKVATNATKAEIREAVERIYSVNVTGVSTVNVKGKVKRNFRGRVSRFKNWKKAYVRIQEGQDIDFMAVGN